MAVDQWRHYLQF
jgi:hypothetical protein